MFEEGNILYFTPFYFKNGNTAKNKYFDFKTHIYDYQLDSYKLKDLNEIYQFESADYEFYGKMRKDIFTELINCLKNSRSVKRKFKKYLDQ